MDVKIEIGSEICQGCLSQQRRTYPLGEFEIFYNLMLGNTVTFDRGGTTMLKMCWECIAKLKSFKHFRDQLYQAQNILINMFYKVDAVIPSLSKLSTITKDNYDYEFNHTITNITDNSINLTDNKPNGITFEIEPVIKIEKPMDIDISQYNEENDYYTDNDLLPDLYSSASVKEENNDTKKMKIKKEYKKRNSQRYYKFCVIKNAESVKITDNNEVKNFFNHVCLDEKEIEELVHKKERESSICYKFKCEICKLGFLAHIDLKRHLSLYHHEPDKANKCIVCKINLPTFDALRLHWKKNHSHYYVCKLCNEYVRKAVKVKHLKFRHTKRICCKGCKLEFPTMYSFSIHYKKEHDKYICDHCNKVCFQREVLIKHIERKHNSHDCPICCKRFKGYRPYQVHMSIYHPELVNKAVDKESAYCVECNRQFPSVAVFKNHLRDSVKHGYVRQVVSIPCPECGKIFRRPEYMKNHLHQVHMQEKAKHYCAICNKYYSNNWGLKNHNLNIHLKVPKTRDKICDLCGRGFHTNRILINHRRTHTGERPFQCSFCSATFAQKTAMMSHQKTQHRDITR